MQIQAIKILNGNNGSQVIKVGYPMACPDGEDRGVLSIEDTMKDNYRAKLEDGTVVVIRATNVLVQYYSA